MMQGLRQWLQSSAALRFIQHQYQGRHGTLLSAAEVEAIEHRVYTINNPGLIKHRNSQYPQYGEDPSARLGSGYDFADNRLFQSGDERRHINWRQYARSQVLHLKQFHEELNPSVMVVLDKRSPMFFGSKTRLKVQQAAMIALAIIFYARKQGLDTGLLTLGHQLDWQRPAPIAQGVDKLVSIVNEADGFADNDEQVALDRVFNLLNSKLVAGSQIFLISDFHDLDSSSSTHLWQMHQGHNITAIYVSDELESRIPDAGKINFQSDQGVVAIDSHNKAIRKQYQQTMQQHQQHLEKLLQSSSSGFYRIKTHDDAVQTLLGGSDAV
jgi:uncharacterized protein (DUF58 family)